MELKDFVIGGTFWTENGAFRCTDIGTRVVVAVKLGPRDVSRAETVDGELRITRQIDDDPSWLHGPPYAVIEHVFDEYDLPGCYGSEEELRMGRRADVRRNRGVGDGGRSRLKVGLYDGPEA